MYSKKSNEKREKLMIKPYIFTSIEYENATYLTKEKKEYTLIEYSNSGGEFHVKHSSRNTHSAISDYERKEKEYSDFLKLPKDKQFLKLTDLVGGHVKKDIYCPKCKEVGCFLVR